MCHADNRRLSLIGCWCSLTRGPGHSKFLLCRAHGLNAVVHVLDEVDLSATESTEVRDVEDAVVGLGVLTVGTTDLNEVLISDSVEFVLVLLELGELDVNGSTHTGTEVGGAG